MDNQDSKRIGHIYGIKNIANGFWYIGQTRDIRERKSRHFLHLKKNKHYNSHLQNAYNKYGKDCFEFHILEEVEYDMLDFRECAWIKHYKSNNKKFGYNKMSGGSSSGLHSEETKNKQREIRKKMVSEKPEVRGGHQKGIPLSEEHRRILSIAAKKRWASKEEREKQSKRYKGIKQDPIFLAKRVQAIKNGWALKKQRQVNCLEIINN